MKYFGPMLDPLLQLDDEGCLGHVFFAADYFLTDSQSHSNV